MSGIKRVFSDGFNGMVIGFFVTMIIGTILKQIGNLTPGQIGGLFVLMGKTAISVTGAGVGVGVAYKMNESPLVVISVAITGMIGYSAASAEPLGAFVAAVAGILVGEMIADKTSFDLLLTPFLSILVGTIVGRLAGPYIARLVNELAKLIKWGAAQDALIMGIVVAVLMCLAAVFPIHVAALGASLKMSGLACGAATIGVCCSMIGFAVASYRENKTGGLFTQGIGTSMLQFPNLFHNPLILIPPVVASAILGPVSVCLLKMTNSAAGCGMGTRGFAGQISAYYKMAGNKGTVATMLLIFMMHIILPGVISLGLSELLRKMKWIKGGDMRIDV